MEYRRRTYRKKGKIGRTRETRGGANSRGSLGGFIIVLLLIAASVYLISASAAGTWLAKEVFAPIFSAFGEKITPTMNPNQTNTPQDSIFTMANSGNETDITVELPAISCYALQMGVFSTEQNASANATTIKAQGAGGYVYGEGGLYRVLASGYSDEASAKSVRDRLRNAGNDCALHIIEADKRTFIVTTDSTSEQETAVRKAFSSMLQAQRQLVDLAIAFDKDNMTPTAAADKLRNIKEELVRDFSILAEQTANNDALNKIVACYNTYIAAFNELEQASTQTNVAYSSLIKYSQLKLAIEYSTLLKTL